MIPKNKGRGVPGGTEWGMGWVRTLIRGRFSKVFFSCGRARGLEELSPHLPACLPVDMCVHSLEAWAGILSPLGFSETPRFSQSEQKVL